MNQRMGRVLKGAFVHGACVDRSAATAEISTLEKGDLLLRGARRSLSSGWTGDAPVSMMVI